MSNYHLYVTASCWRMSCVQLHFGNVQPFPGRKQIFQFIEITYVVESSRIDVSNFTMRNALNLSPIWTLGFLWHHVNLEYIFEFDSTCN